MEIGSEEVLGQESANCFFFFFLHNVDVFPSFSLSKLLYIEKDGNTDRITEKGNKTHVYKLLLLALVLGAAGLVLEDDVVVPPALHVEVLLVEERVSQGNVSFSGFLLFLEPLGFLPTDAVSQPSLLP